MNNTFLLSLFLILLSLQSCNNKSKKSQLPNLINQSIDHLPKEFTPNPIPDNLLVHKGIFTPDMTEYFYTLSDKSFEQFDVFCIKWKDDKWTEPQTAFFNSSHNEHGMSFSPSGNSLFFASTRPTDKEQKKGTWQIWHSKKVNEKWKRPQLIEFPNLKGKLISHPSITESGSIYFHSANPDYSEMHLYRSKMVNGKYIDAEKVVFPNNPSLSACTPFVSPQEDYLLFAAITDQLDLMISLNDDNGGWLDPIRLDELINTNCQGNPFVTPDGQYLLFTSGDHSGGKWHIKISDFQSVLKNIKSI